MIQLKGTISDSLTAATVSIVVDGQTLTPPVANGSFEQEISLPSLKTYQISVIATDAAGNATTVPRNVIRAGAWADITSQLMVTKGSALYDRLNNCYYTLNTIRNSKSIPVAGPLRMVITGSTIPVKNLQAVGWKIAGYTPANEPYFNIVSSGSALSAGASLSNLRVNFENMRVPLSYGVRIEQFR